MGIFVGIDWAERHHDVAAVDSSGAVLTQFRIGDGITGFAQLRQTLTGLSAEADRVQVALETDRGLLVAALAAAGYQVFAINPKSVDRYRDRYSVSGAKSDPGDALVLAHLLRTDGPRHRPLPANSPAVSSIAALARAHQDAIRLRHHEMCRLRSLLREFYPAALAAFPGALTTRSAIAVLTAAPTPAAAATLSPAQLRELIYNAGRYAIPQQVIARLHTTFQAEQLRQPPAVEQAMGHAVHAILAALTACNSAISELETELGDQLDRHPYAEILRSLPGLGPVLGARVLGEFGDDPNCYADAASRRRYAGTAPVTRTSGKSRLVHLRRARNARLLDACRCWAFSAITRSPGANAYYRTRRAAGDSHEAALRRLANKQIGHLHHCLQHEQPYREDIAWPDPAADLAADPDQPDRQPATHVDLDSRGVSCAQPDPAHTRTPGGGGNGSAGAACEAGRAQDSAQHRLAFNERLQMLVRATWSMSSDGPERCALALWTRFS